MLVLAGIGLLAGIITAISPCVLPVLPVVLAASATPGAAVPGERRRAVRRRPVLVVGGLVLSFGAFTLLGSWLLDVLHLPQDTLQIAGLVVLGLLGLILLVPLLDRFVERPFVRLARGARPRGGDGRGFILGLSLGVVFVPCAGPVLAAITVLGAAHRISLDTLVLTASYAVGVGIPLLGLALAGEAMTSRLRVLRAHALTVRRSAGAVLIAAAVVIGLGLPAQLQRSVPGYTDALQQKVENNSVTQQHLRAATGSGSGCLTKLANEDGLDPGGCTAPEFRGISHWLNTPDDQPLSLPSLRGRVVLVDFWTYSCINCQRTIPHLRAWDQAYRGRGLTVVGVHTPEFAFEHELRNVRSNAGSLGVRYPVAIDNDFATWNAYDNQYWPAEYLIDKRGVIRHVHFGEGAYDETESYIRQLLDESDAQLGARTKVADTTPEQALTPESYLGYRRLNNVANGKIYPDKPHGYDGGAAVPDDALAYDGTWTVGPEAAVAGDQAALYLRFTARNVYLVLGGDGTVAVSIDGRHVRTLRIAGSPRLYTLVSGAAHHGSLLRLDVSRDVSAYSFTFG